MRMTELAAAGHMAVPERAVFRTNPQNPGQNS
jgi:hypothetical protein